jgi:hypothetical protein
MKEMLKTRIDKIGAMISKMSERREKYAMKMLESKWPKGKDGKKRDVVKGDLRDGFFRFKRPSRPAGWVCPAVLRRQKARAAAAAAAAAKAAAAQK